MARKDPHPVDPRPKRPTPRPRPKPPNPPQPRKPSAGLPLDAVEEARRQGREAARRCWCRLPQTVQDRVWQLMPPVREEAA